MDLVFIIGIATAAFILGCLYGQKSARADITTMGTLIFQQDEDGGYLFLQTPHDPMEFLEHDHVIFEINRPQD